MIFKWWMAPVIGVGLCAVANGVLIATALRVRPEKTSARPYLESAEEDARAAERDAFAARGWRLAEAVDGGGCTLTLSGPPSGGAMVAVYRPDDRTADRRVAWPDTSAPLRLELPRPGAWSLHVEVRDGKDTATRAVRVNRP